MNEQLSIFDLPPLPYVRHSETSKEAAIKAEPASGTQRRRVLEELRKHPAGLTDEQMQALLGMNPSTQRPRRVELEKSGQVIDSGIKRPTQSGRSAVVWVAIRA